PEQVRLADPRTPRDHLGRSPRVPVHRELRDRLREHQLPPPLRGHPRPPGPPAARGHLRPRGPLANRLLSHASKVSNHSLLCQPLAHPLPPRPPRLAAKGGAWPTRPPLGRFGGHAPPAGPPPPASRPPGSPPKTRTRSCFGVGESVESRPAGPLLRCEGRNGFHCR